MFRLILNKLHIQFFATCEREKGTRMPNYISAPFMKNLPPSPPSHKSCTPPIVNKSKIWALGLRLGTLLSSDDRLFIWKQNASRTHLNALFAFLVIFDVLNVVRDADTVPVCRFCLSQFWKYFIAPFKGCLFW